MYNYIRFKCILLAEPFNLIINIRQTFEWYTVTLLVMSGSDSRILPFTNEIAALPISFSLDKNPTSYLSLLI